ncbi:MAG: hypothetical protein RL220_1908 [Bacteroidota bacterium]|jgi:acyl carrier protein phosphodiesterase
MNYLAHAYLSFGQEEMLVGQFIADHIRGNDYGHFPANVQQGIVVHRFIDGFTDGHEVNLALRALIRHEFQLWSPVAIDLMYDHVLATRWQDFHDTPLQDFARDSYDILHDYKSILPEKAAYILEHMSKGDWLSGYATHEGISMAFRGMSRRITRGEPLLRGPAVISEQDILIRGSFDRFFPELVLAVRDKISSFASV